MNMVDTPLKMTEQAARNPWQDELVTGKLQEVLEVAVANAQAGEHDMTAQQREAIQTAAMAFLDHQTTCPFLSPALKTELDSLATPLSLGEDEEDNRISTLVGALYVASLTTDMLKVRLGVKNSDEEENPPSHVLASLQQSLTELSERLPDADNPQGDAATLLSITGIIHGHPSTHSSSRQALDRFDDLAILVAYGKSPDWRGPCVAVMQSLSLVGEDEESKVAGDVVSQGRWTRRARTEDGKEDK